MTDRRGALLAHSRDQGYRWTAGHQIGLDLTDDGRFVGEGALIGMGQGHRHGWTAGRASCGRQQLAFDEQAQATARSIGLQPLASDLVGEEVLGNDRGAGVGKFHMQACTPLIGDLAADAELRDGAVVEAAAHGGGITDIDLREAHQPLHLRHGQIGGAIGLESGGASVQIGLEPPDIEIGRITDPILRARRDAVGQRPQGVRAAGRGALRSATESGGQIDAGIERQMLEAGIVELLVYQDPSLPEGDAGQIPGNRRAVRYSHPIDQGGDGAVGEKLAGGLRIDREGLAGGVQPSDQPGPKAKLRCRQGDRADLHGWREAAFSE